jgi:methylmalonyl-CoA/ethylmalonyl-CoA epimerase
MPVSKSQRLDHVAIALKNIDEVEKVYVSALGLKVKHRETIHNQGVRTTMLVPEKEGASIELMEPLDENSPISNFIDKRGEGIHHICFIVDDIEEALSRLNDQEIELIDETPRQGASGAKVAFIHPKAMHGVLIELAEMPE